VKSSSEIVCPACQATNPPIAQFCRKCGKKLPQKIVQHVHPKTVDVEESSTTLLSKIEVANIEQPHCATLLLLDTSGSMIENNKIQQLNEGLKLFKEEILKDDLASSRVDVAIVAFGDGVKAVHPFSSIQDFIPPQLDANGNTPMGEAILYGIDLIEKRKSIYRNLGVSYFRPWIFMITDGEPTDMKPGDSTWVNVKSMMEDCEKNNKLVFFSVGVEPANMERLKELMPPSRGPIKLREGNFREMFRWLSNSQEKIVKSDIKPGEMVKLEAPTGWGENPLN
jgi:uncharacterized protein YegL